MELKELIKTKKFQRRRIELLRQTIKDANSDWMTYRELAEVFWESYSSLWNFVNKKIDYSHNKAERLLIKCGLWKNIKN